MSGLQLNIDKTKCLKIGADVSDNINNSYNVKCVDELKILGITFNKNNNDITTINITNKLPQIEKEIIQWNRRHLTIIGKITVLKALLISKLVHIFTSLPNPRRSVLKRLEELFFSFIWTNKTDRIKRTKLAQPLEQDGLNMIHLKSFIKSMKISWIERLYRSSMCLSASPLFHMGDIRLYGSKKLNIVKAKINNEFWQNVLEAWIDFVKLYEPCENQLITELLWYTDISKFSNSIVKDWDTKGIRHVADLINNKTGRLYTKEEIQSIYNVKMTFLCYRSLIKSLPDIVSRTNYKSKITYPIIPYKICLANGYSKLSKTAYNEFRQSLKTEHKKADEKMKSKWIKEINFYKTGSMLDICTITKNTYIQAFHFRFISRLIPTKKFLYVIGKAENDKCTFCLSTEETLMHLFWECQHVTTFRSKLTQILLNNHQVRCDLKKKTWFLPSLDECSPLEIMIVTIGKITIFKAQNKNIPLSVNHFLNTLRFEITKENQSAIRNNNIESFHAKWQQLASIIK